MDEEKFNQLCATRRGKLGVCTRKMNEIREAMNSGNVEAVSTGLEELNVALNDFRNVHQSVQVLLDEEESKSDNDDWYLPKIQTFETFLKEVATWKVVQKDLQAVISPSDSISNVSGSKRKSSRSIASSSSKTTSVSSARLRAEAEKAALLQRTEGLKKKHALELERIEVQNAMERVELETELAAVHAKMRVLQSFDTECIESKLISSEGSESPGDGMNKYLKSHQGTNGIKESLQPEPSPVEYAKISVIPKTPLQRALTHNVRLQRSQGPCQMPPLTRIGQTSADATLPLAPSGLSSNNLGAITDLIVQQQNMSSLPTRHVPVFNGEPLNFKPFMQAFEHCIENKTNSNQDRLYYLEQYTSGQPKELVRSCLHMDADRGFAEAKRLLEHHFGDEFKITNAYMEKALNWNNIPVDNGEALHSYALFLRGCL